MIDNVNMLVLTNTDSVTQAMENINNINFEELNQAINDLSEVVGSLTSITSIFK